MNQLELNIVESFRRAKGDIINLQSQVVELSQKQEQLMQVLIDTRDKNNSLYTRVKEIKDMRRAVKAVNRNTHEFVASSEGKKFHITECPFAKNIKPKSRIVFKSKTKALNDGYKPCKCVVKV